MHEENSESSGDKILQQVLLSGRYDVAFLIVNGPCGEDGALQGLIEHAHIPYTSGSVLSSGVCKDKPITQEIVRANGIPVVRYRASTRETFLEDSTTVIKTLISAQVPSVCEANYARIPN